MRLTGWTCQADGPTELTAAGESSSSSMLSVAFLSFFFSLKLSNLKGGKARGWELAAEGGGKRGWNSRHD